MFVSHNNVVFRYDLDQSPAVELYTSARPIQEMFFINDFLILETNDDYININTNNGDVIDQENFFYESVGHVSINSLSKVYSRNTGVSPSDLVSFVVNPDGTFGAQNDSPYHGDYPNANRVYSFADGSRVVDGSGIVYHALDSTYAGSLAGPFDHADFHVNLPVVMRGNTLHAYTNTFVESGSYDLSGSKDTFFIHDGDIHLFKYELSNVSVEVVGFDELSPDEPGKPVNPVGLAYSADSIQYDNKDKVYILSRNNLTIFVYNVSTMSYESGIPLNHAPLFMDYSPAIDKLYLAYADGRVSQVDLSTFEETISFNTPQTPCGLESVGNYTMVCDPTGAWVSHMTFNHDGVLISSKDWNYYSEEYHWSDANKKLYHYRDDTSPNDLLWENIGINGVIGDDLDSPYHSSIWSYPLCVHPDGDFVLVGSGKTYNAITLIEENDLEESILGCGWSRDILYTFENASNAILNSWSDNFISNEEGSWPGSPIQMVPLQSGSILIVTDVEGVPHFDLFNDEIFSTSFE